MFVDVFIRRPILSSVLALVIILAGVIAIPTLPIAQYPELAPPQVSVSAFYTGANAQAGWNIGVLTGAHPRERLAAEPHTHIVESVAVLPQLFQRE